MRPTPYFCRLLSAYHLVVMLSAPARPVSAPWPTLKHTHNRASSSLTPQIARTTIVSANATLALLIVLTACVAAPPNASEPPKMCFDKLDTRLGEYDWWHGVLWLMDRSKR